MAKGDKKEAMAANWRSSLDEYLRNSTIHGLSYVASGTIWISRCLWILLVFCGFFLAGFILMGLLTSWSQNPVSSSTTVEDLTSEVIPDIVVCPPLSNSRFAYDIDASKNWEMTNDKR